MPKCGECERPDRKPARVRCPADCATANAARLKAPKLTEDLLKAVGDPKVIRAAVVGAIAAAALASYTPPEGKRFHPETVEFYFQPGSGKLPIWSIPEMRLAQDNSDLMEVELQEQLHKMKRAEEQAAAEIGDHRSYLPEHSGRMRRLNRKV